MIAWANLNSGFLIACLTLALVLVAGGYTALLRRTLREAERRGLDSALPIVRGVWEEVWLRKGERPSPRPILVRNAGPGLALDVAVDTMHGSQQARRSLPALEAGEEWLAGSVTDWLQGPEHPEGGRWRWRPDTLTVSVTCRDIYGRTVATSTRADGSFHLAVAGQARLR